MIRQLRIFLFAALATGLTACGPLQQDNETVDRIVGLAGSIFASGDSGGGAPVTLSRAQIDAYPSNLMLIGVISRDAAAYVFPGGLNGTKETWLSEDGLSVVFDRGQLIATRGFGFDMMGANVSGALAGLSGAPSHRRTYDFLNGVNDIEQPIFQCETQRVRSEVIEIAERSFNTTVFEEDCVGESDTFKNVYWRENSGTIRQSRQWVSPGLGYIGYQRLY